MPHPLSDRTAEQNARAFVSPETRSGVIIPGYMSHSKGDDSRDQRALDLVKLGYNQPPEKVGREVVGGQKKRRPPNASHRE